MAAMGKRMLERGEPLFNVTFSGELEQGRRVEDVTQALLLRLKTDQAKIESLFSGRKKLIKQAVVLEKAERYIRAFRKSGAIAHIELVTDDTSESHWMEDLGAAGTTQSSAFAPEPASAFAPEPAPTSGNQRTIERIRTPESVLSPESATASESAQTFEPARPLDPLQAPPSAGASGSAQAPESVLNSRSVSAPRPHPALVSLKEHRGKSALMLLILGGVLGFAAGNLVVDSPRTEIFGPSPKAQAEIQSLQADLDTLERVTSEAQARRENVSGGLLRALVEERLEILRGTSALLNQRIQALEAGATLAVEVAGTEPNPELAESLSQEMARQIGILEDAKAGADGFPGGLIGALKQSVVAREEQTLAILRQRYFAALYGLPVTRTIVQTIVAEEPLDTGASARLAAAETIQDLGALHQGPFGLEMGMTLDALGGGHVKLSPGKYILAGVPRPNSAFATYTAQVAAKSGLCWINASGTDILTNSYGLQVQNAFYAMEESLKAVYGSHKRTDMLLPGSVLRDPQDWMQAVAKRDRILHSVWNADSGADLPGNLERVELFVSSSSMSTGYITVEYAFENEDACNAEIASGSE